MPGLTGHLIPMRSQNQHNEKDIITDYQQITSPKVSQNAHLCTRNSLCFNIRVYACGEYASRTLAGKQAPSMAKTTAIDSKQCRRAKPEGSPALLCALGSRFWGESPDDNVISHLSSGYLGRKPGRETFFLHLIRISGEISRTSVAPPYTLERLWAKSDRGVSKNKFKTSFLETAWQ